MLNQTHTRRIMMCVQIWYSCWYLSDNGSWDSLMLILFIMYKLLAERTSSAPRKLSACTRTPHKALLGCKPLKAARFQWYCLCFGEAWWMCQGRPSTYSPLRVGQPKCHSWMLERLCINQQLFHTCTCLTPLEGIVVICIKVIILAD